MASAEYEIQQRVEVQIPPTKPFFHSLKSSLKETFFPDDPFKQFKNQTVARKFLLGCQYFVPILEWAPRYTFEFFKADFIAGITIASLAVPQGISYAGLASLPPVIGLCKFQLCAAADICNVGSSRDLAVGTVAVPSLLISSMLGKEVNPHQNTKLYVQLVLTATFFAGVFQAALGLLSGDGKVEYWGCCFLLFLFTTRYFSRKKPVFFWINALAPLTSVIMGSLLVYLTHAENHGIEIIGHLKKGLNPPSLSELETAFGSPHLTTAIKTGIITGVIALAEGIAVGRSFSVFKSYHIDGNKDDCHRNDEHSRFLHILLLNHRYLSSTNAHCQGNSLSISAYLTLFVMFPGPFSRTAVNFNAGCKTAVSNIVMATAVMITLLFLTPLFYYTPLVVLSAIIITAMVSLIDYEAAIHLWAVDKFDFIVCISAYIGVVFGSVETGLVIAVAISLLRILLFVARPKTSVMGGIPNSMTYRSIEQYPKANLVPGILILHINAPVYFANASYLRERISRWIDEEEEKLKYSANDLQYVVLDMSAVGSIDTSGISMLEEIKRNADRRCIKLVLANPGGEVMKKLEKSKFIDTIGQEWIYVTVGEAVNACNFMLQTCKPKSKAVDEEADDKV
ncbi:UNVERIFIED_CONTAM: Sulfate transporter 3.1 [Sesamum calycinum]|uniref:Sulfate transporter 3.1 n=1 Tax=Sesamum calycinum TaxID=2727403 RepID=A0AAW2IR27_9LAMI